MWVKDPIKLLCTHSDDKIVYDFNKFKNPVDFCFKNTLDGTEREQNEMSVETIHKKT